ncbi:carbohydrate ABC transporter permease [Reinekea marinisedimentorum]|uniref:Multiple sugar transport system permease protein n=1 Tax=Reinekea marinisedimentorum TaxID=230495 RepID=A0A4R3I6C8_9GAMM|nr:sugar ABC transporter permease [Reinekea marinisedimentorum]TCS40353.1 multiple sugar transport system permease protein [Reinekea marinisedimentorum]
MTLSTTQAQAAPIKKNYRGPMSRLQSRYGLLMIAPAVFFLLMFLVTPTLMAFYMSFTNQRLISPNPTEFVGLRNYDRALALSVIRLPAERDEQGNIQVDDDGNTEFPRLRTVTRKDEKYKGFRELYSWESDDTKTVLVAKDPIFYKSFYNTFRFAFMVVPLQVAMALGLALLINRQMKGVNFFRSVYFAPVVTSMVVVSIVWSFFFNKDMGLFNRYLEVFSFGLIEGPNWLGDPAYAMKSIVIMSAWQGAGVQMLIFLAGLQGISKDLYEAASIDGANGWHKFRFITLPGLRNTFVFVVIATTIAAFGLYTQVAVMTAGGPVDSTTTVMYHAVRKGQTEQDMGYGSTITVIYFAVILIIALLQKLYFERKGD